MFLFKWNGSWSIENKTTFWILSSIDKISCFRIRYQMVGPNCTWIYHAIIYIYIYVLFFLEEATRLMHTKDWYWLRTKKTIYFFTSENFRLILPKRESKYYIFTMKLTATLIKIILRFLTTRGSLEFKAAWSPFWSK